jgi:hypothetical protein
MPRYVNVGANPNFKPENAAEKAAFEELKKRPVMSVTVVTAMENTRINPMYAILADVAAPTAPAVRSLEDMQNEELKILALQAGVDMSKKQMKKAEIIKAIRLKLDSVEIADDDVTPDA